MKNNQPSASARIVRASLPLLVSALLCAVLLHHLPPTDTTQATAASQAQNTLLASTTIMPGLEITLEQPVLTPPAVECKKDFWQPIPSGRDTTAYLTMNVNTPAASTNSGEWRPNLPARGYYRVEAYIPLHDPIDFCTDGIGIISSDTSQAHYTVRHALGSIEVVRSQVLPSEATRWVSLGEFLLPAGTEAFVRLTDLNSEANLTRTISFSAVRFTYLRPAPQPIHLPLITNYKEPPLPPAVVTTKGQGFDVCIPPSLDKMQTWWDESPYKSYGLYLGGISYAVGCTLPTPAWVTSVSAQGWQFMPIWVGPQAPCYGYRHPMSYDLVEAYHQGRAEAALAAAAARDFGLANTDLGGSLIYYNLEAYGTNPTAACQAAVEAFINGWTERLHELGNAAGVYAAACASHPSELATLPNTPEYLWGASWYASTYDPNASVFGMLCLSDNLWANHQRIRQYTGGHKETWGGEEILIDSNVIDGAVLQPALASRQTPEIAESSAVGSMLVADNRLIQDTGWLSVAQGWLVQAGRLYWSTNGGQTWDERTPAGAILSLATFMDTDHGWALSTPSHGRARLHQTQDGGAQWQATDLPVSADAWQAMQLGRDGNRGWIVLRRATSAAFDIALLLRTQDDGQTWVSSDLPASGRVTLTATGEAWLEAQRVAGWYHSTDGGRAWQPAQAKAAPFQVQTKTLGASLPDRLAGETVLTGSANDQLIWSVTRRAACLSEKLSPGFTCTQSDTLWLSVDNGVTWEIISQP